MIPRFIKLQLFAFVVVAILAVTYAGLQVVLPTALTPTYTVKADFANAGGTFVRGEVTYRGVDVGTITSLKLLPNAVQITMRIKKSTAPISTDLKAVVADKSAVGEQYVDLEPQSDSGPYLHQGSVIPMSQTAIPIDVNNLVVDIDDTVRSVNLNDLTTVVNELAKASANTAGPVNALITNGDKLTSTLQSSVPDTLKLINASEIDLQTARDTAEELQEFSTSLSSLSDQLVTSDPDIRGVLDNGVAASQQLNTLLSNIQPNLLPLLGSLVTATSITAARIPALKQTLILLPVAAGKLVQAIHPVGQLYTPLTLGETTTPICTYPAKIYLPSAYDTPLQASEYCPADDSIAPRGGRYAPRPKGDDTGGPATSESDTGGPDPNLPSQSSGDTELYAEGAYDPTTELASTDDGTYFGLVPDAGLSPAEAKLLGDQSWMAVLLNLIAK